MGVPPIPKRGIGGGLSRASLRCGTDKKIGTKPLQSLTRKTPQFVKVIVH